MLIIENNKFIDCNEAILKMLHCTSKKKLLNTHPSQLSPKYQPNGQDSFSLANEKMKVALDEGSNIFDWVHLRANKEVFWVEVVLTRIFTKTQTLLLVAWRDIGQKKVLQQRQEEDYKAIFKYAKSGLAIMDLESNFLEFNDAHLKVTGYTRKELLQTSCVKMSSHEDIPRSRAVVEKVIDEGYVQSYEKSCIRKDGGVVDVEMSLVLLPDKERILISVRDVTERNFINKELLKSKEKLIKQAHYDALTHIPNRTLFQDRLKQSIGISKRNSTKFALLFMDLDKFKLINDTYGHQTGDQFLVKVVKKISTIVRASDTFARIGGDEFTIIMNNIKNKDDITSFIKKLFFILKDSIVVNNTQLNASLSIGVTICPDDTSISKDILIYSDLAMYYVKENKQNDFAFYNHTMSENK